MRWLARSQITVGETTTIVESGFDMDTGGWGDVPCRTAEQTLGQKTKPIIHLTDSDYEDGDAASRVGGTINK